MAKSLSVAALGCAHTRTTTHICFIFQRERRSTPPPPPPPLPPVVLRSHAHMHVLVRRLFPSSQPEIISLQVECQNPTSVQGYCLNQPARKVAQPASVTFPALKNG